MSIVYASDPLDVAMPGANCWTYRNMRRWDPSQQLDLWVLDWQATNRVYDYLVEVGSVPYGRLAEVKEMMNQFLYEEGMEVAMQKMSALGWIIHFHRQRVGMYDPYDGIPAE